jgi:hypothetical protein
MPSHIRKEAIRVGMDWEVANGRPSERPQEPVQSPEELLAERRQEQAMIARWRGLTAYDVLEGFED